jgi:hypothetical protein
MAVCAALLGALGLVLLGDLRENAAMATALLFVWAVLVVLLPKPARGPGWVLAAALLLRCVLLPSPPTLSDDVFRYIWEGGLSLSGGNPYLDPPSSFLPGGGDALQAVNHPEVPSVYPPPAMWVFAVLSTTWLGALPFKAFMGLCDALCAWTLARTLEARGATTAPAWLYALHPLGAVESAGSGHMESLALLPLLLAIQAHESGRSGVFLSAAGGAFKLLPLLLLPAFWSRKGWLVLPAGILAVLCCLPFAADGLEVFSGLGTYARHWSFNGSAFPILEWLAPGVGRPVGLAAGAAICIAVHRLPGTAAEKAMRIGGAFVLLSPTVHPWYVLWVWAPSLLCGRRSWTHLACTVQLSYVALMGYDPGTQSWSPPLWPQLIQYVPLLLLLVSESAWRQIRPGPWGTGTSGAV